MTENPKKTNQFAGLQILHKILLFGQVIFGAVAFFLIWSKSFLSPLQEYNKPLQVVAILLSFAGFYIGTILIFKKRLAEIRESNLEVASKLDKYRAASIVQWTLLEGPCLFSVVCFLLVGNYSFLALAITLMLLFALMGASKGKVMLLLNLSEADMKGL